MPYNLFATKSLKSQAWRSLFKCGSEHLIDWATSVGMDADSLARILRAALHNELMARPWRYGWGFLCLFFYGSFFCIV